MTLVLIWGRSIRWKLKEVLDQNRLTAYQLMKESGLAGSTIYRLRGGKTEGVQGKVLDRILTALHALTGKAFDVGDVLEWQPSKGER